MTLRERLERERARLMALPAVREAVDATLAALRRRRVGEAALGAGAPFPDFLLPDTEGRLVARDDVLAGGPVVMTFFRGDWCPYCAIVMDAMEAALPRFEAEGGRLVAVMPETDGRALDAARRHRARYRILADVDNGLAAACGIAFRVPEPYRRMLLEVGVDLMARQGNGAWILPIPATFVLGRDGIVARAFVDVDFTIRAEPEEVAAVLHGLRLREAGAPPAPDPAPPAPGCTAADPRRPGARVP